ncbi:MAG: efflux RND transporter permease subunit [Oligoflexia bacterium]|nr:efflux RND transporter permease subunit [Oligoflexia bacterium]
MNLVDLSIKRPIFITCLVIVMLAVGYWCLRTLGVDLFPNVTFPVVTISTPYPGASPNEIETLISKPIEDELSTVSGIKRLSSNNSEGLSVVIAEFTMETDVKYAEQQIRDRVSSVKRKLPSDIDEPVIRRIDPGDNAVLILSMDADLPDLELYEIADKVVRPKLEQVNQVGLVEIYGGREREIHVELDRKKLKSYEIPATQVAARLKAAGENIPVGKVTEGNQEIAFRSIGQFSKVDDIKNTVVNFFGSDVPVTVADVGAVTDTMKDETSRAFVNGKKSLFVMVYRQSGANTIAVVKNVLKQIDKVNVSLKDAKGKPEIHVVRDASKWIQANVTDVQESIFIGIILAVLVVYYFLANGRSTFITGLALPNSLIGAFILMTLAGFTINIMTLLALSLAVGLLIDDAIVVRENIFRHIEMGKSPAQAARIGTKEVQLAVIATTFTVLAVFGPVGFLKGVVGQFFREFGLTICFAMLISLFDALTVAPMLSAYFAASAHEKKKENIWDRTVGRSVKAFTKFQDWLELRYEGLLKTITSRPLITLGLSVVVFIFSVSTVIFVPKTFLPTQDAGEFQVSYDLPPGTALDETNRVGIAIDEIIRANKEIHHSAMIIGGQDGSPNVGSFFVTLVPSKERTVNTSEMKARIREQLKSFAYANVAVKDFDAVGGGQRPFNLNIVGQDQKQLEEYAQKVLAVAKKHPGLTDVDVNYRPGKPELQIEIDKNRADKLGVSTMQVGSELRAQIEGITAAKFRESGEEYDVRVRLTGEQRDLKASFNDTYVPNINNNLVRLKDVANGIETEGPSKITRQDRSRYIQIQADIAPGAGMGDVMNDLNKTIKDDIKLPSDMSFAYVGQAENFQELGESMGTAVVFGVLFIFLILASLYESFVTPFTIMLALPLALCGSFVALAITGESLNIFSMIGVIMLLGVATKNSILLVDYANQRTAEGMDRAKAMIEAGKIRLRPILMTTMALIAGTVPIAIGLNEASKQRTSMGVAIIGGLISSTLLTLLVIPAAYLYIDRFRVWSSKVFSRLVGNAPREEMAGVGSSYLESTIHDKKVD